MPDADRRRLSRLTAKLLRRRSSSSSFSSAAKPKPDDAHDSPQPPGSIPKLQPQTQTEPKQHLQSQRKDNDYYQGDGADDDDGGSAPSRRHSQLSQLSQLSSLVGRTNPSSSVVSPFSARPPSPTSPQTVLPVSAVPAAAAGKQSRLEYPKPRLTAPDPSSPSFQCPPPPPRPPPSTTTSTARSTLAPRAPPHLPPTPASSLSSSQRPAARATDVDAAGAISPGDPTTSPDDAQKTATASQPQESRGPEEDTAAVTALSKESYNNASYFPRLSRQSTRSVPASTRSLNVVDEKPPDSFTPPLAQPLPKAAQSPSPVPSRPSIAVRRQSLVPSSQQSLIKNLLDPARPPSTSGDYFSSRESPSIQPDMISRKIWVKRAGCSPTLVTVTEEDLVDDLREAILKKYANSLGHSCDAPDLLLKLIPREPSSKHSHQERTLGPEELVGRTLDVYYPNGQTVDEALIVDVPPRRTPKPSPRHNVTFHHQDLRQGEAGEYFPPMGVVTTAPSNNNGGNHGPGSMSPSSSAGSHQHHHHHSQPQSMSIISTGQLPPLPSPGHRGSWHQQQHRPKTSRHSTSSPTMITSVPANIKNDSINPPTNGTAPVPSPPAVKTPAGSVPDPTAKPAATPPARSASPRLPWKQVAKLKMSSSTSNKTAGGSAAIPASLLDGSVPPINVLIVEDNSINLKLLEAFMKRLKVRWQTAMNGRDAVNKWRLGGFHLVLMDIQLPVMNGLDATREIRRLERLNGIGVYSKTVSGGRPAPTSNDDGAGKEPPETNGDNPSQSQDTQRALATADTLDKRTQFKSPVIIVALTASSLQSDRHEALAAGCNDFLTKPVNMMWLEQKVTEWGCMQALIDFDGWRTWRGFTDDGQANAAPAAQP